MFVAFKAIFEATNYKKNVSENIKKNVAYLFKKYMLMHTSSWLPPVMDWRCRASWISNWEPSIVKWEPGSLVSDTVLLTRADIISTG